MAFDSIKSYLMNPSVLSAPIPRKMSILYTAALEGSLGTLFAQNNEDGKENALYYINTMLVGAEHNYLAIEKYCLALIFAMKLSHYLLVHQVILIS